MKKRIPEGDYRLWVVKAKPTGDALDVTFQVSGEVPGRELVKSFPTRGTRTWVLREMLEACGKQFPRAVVRINLDELIGLECAGTITDDGVICAFFPVRELKQQFAEALRAMEFGPEVPRYVM